MSERIAELRREADKLYGQDLLTLTDAASGLSLLARAVVRRVISRLHEQQLAMLAILEELEKR